MARKNKPHPLYATWLQLRTRCSWKEGPNYKWYGGKGITVDPMWDHFWTFVFDMGPKPTPEPRYSIDRIDTNGPYAPWNCRWATQKEQVLNSSTVTLATVGDITDTQTGWAKRLGINQGTFSRKVARWGFEGAILRGPNRIKNGLPLRPRRTSRPDTASSTP